MNTSLSTFLTAYKTELEASNKRFNDLMFRRALNTKIDMTCIDRIKQGIQNDKPRFDKWCEIMAKRKQDEEDKICCVCYECEADQPLKCSHKLCPTCYDKLTKCPMCRKCDKEPVDDSIAEHERFQRLLAAHIAWNARTIDVKIKMRNADIFDISFPSVARAVQIQRWLKSRSIRYRVNTNKLSIRGTGNIIGLVRQLVEQNMRVEISIRHATVTNQRDGKYQVRCSSMQHVYNLTDYIVDTGNSWGGLYTGTCQVSGIENLTCLMNFLTLPIEQQLQERVHEVDDEDEW